ncbi:MAG: flagellar basal body-associated FliL family protein [Hyphomonadaceae bacterium]
MAGKKDKKGEAEAPEAEAVAEGEDGAPPKKKLAGKTLVLFVILPALLVLGGGGTAAMMLLGGKKEAAATETPHGAEAVPEEGHEAGAKKDEHAKAEGGHGGGEDAHGGVAIADSSLDVGSLIPGQDGNPSYYDMPEMIVNLSGRQEGNGRPLVLKLDLVLEAAEPGAFDSVPVLMPRLQDQVQTFLRELRVEDLDGSAGTYRLRLELLKRFNLVLSPNKIDAVLIEGILIQ